MPFSALDTARLHQLVAGWQAGDRQAADDLVHAAQARLEALARKKLRSFPHVRDWAETADVLQGSLLRLLAALREVCPESTRHFFNLAAVHIRRELLDLNR
jgi:DNA-directed RNA polymerase specialized sigma24 family protein